MIDAELLKEFSELLDKYKISRGVLIYPGEGGEVGVLTIDTSPEHLRQLAHMIIANVTDTRGPLN